MSRISIRPVSLRRVVETIDLCIKKGSLDDKALSTVLKTTQRRAREILLELERMRLLINYDGKMFAAEKRTADFLSAFETENWEKIHGILFDNYVFYNVFMTAIIEKFATGSFSKDELIKNLKDNPYLNFNPTTMDILCEWGERLGILQRNLYDCRFYIVDQFNDEKNFPGILQSVYNEFNTKPRLGIKQQYVEIAKIRESLCEKQKMKREIFDNLLEHAFRESRGEIELCGAPLTSKSKKSSFSLRRMKKGTKDNILSPKFLRLDEAPGLEVDGKEYRFIAIFENKQGVQY